MKKNVIYDQRRRIAVFDIFLPAVRRRCSGDAAALRDAT
jgi:hypothetical protein